MNAEDKLLLNGYDDGLMVEWLMKEDNFTEEEAREWIDFNKIRALPYMGYDGPIVMYGLIDVE